MAEAEKKTKKKRNKERADQGLFIRMTKSDMEALDMASYEGEESKSDIVRKALKMYISARKSRF